MNREKISELAYDIQRQIWLDRHMLWPNGLPSEIDMLHPSTACRIYQFSYEEYPELFDNFAAGGKRNPIGGLIDRQQKKIAVSTNYEAAYTRFTGGHEVGHLILHPEDKILHRDRVVKDQASIKQMARPKKEKEADYFSACYLMPPNLLIERFERIFGKGHVHFDETLSFHLNKHDPQKLMYAERGSLDREFALATYAPITKNHQKLISLADQFKVSPSAMAIRIEEFDLIKWP